MRYALVEITNDTIDACSNHPSGFAVCSTCDTPVSAYTVGVFASRREAIEFASKQVSLNAKIIKSYGVNAYISEPDLVGIYYTNEIGDILDGGWLICYDVVDIPETAEEMKKVSEGSFSSMLKSR